MNDLSVNDLTGSEASKPEEGRSSKICVLLIYIASYLYIEGVLFASSEWLCLIVAALLVICTEFLNKSRKPMPESYVWLGCFAVCVLSYSFDIGSVWRYGKLELFIHIFSVWWVLSRSSVLLEGESGHLLPLDAFNGFIRIPFGNFFLGIKTLLSGFKASKEKSAKKQILWILLVIILCALLFIRAASLLSSADSGFGLYLEDFLDKLRIEIDADVGADIILSIPVWCWLYGLIGGSARFDTSVLERQRTEANSFLARIRRIPAVCWCIAIGAFSVLYLAFFVMQGSYLFGAFTRTLPEGFVVAEYARQGFFELCKVMAVNFALLWLVTRMNDGNGKSMKLITVLCAVLLAESMVFAIVAFSKLALYISCFGYTPLRLQSTWLVCVLFAGCIAWMINLFTGKKTMKMWMYFSAVTLSILALV